MALVCVPLANLPPLRMGIGVPLSQFPCLFLETMAENRAIEFHDSEFRAMRLDARLVRVRLSAYVHASKGKPGRDAGTGWIQECELLIHAPRIEGFLPAGTILADGSLCIDERLYDGLVPIPFEASGAIQLQFQGEAGSLKIMGNRMSLIALGEPKFVEDVPGD